MMNQYTKYVIACSCISLVGLLQIACQSNSASDETAVISKKSDIDPDKFKTKLTPIRAQDSIYEVSITPGSGGMLLENFSVTAYLENDAGTVHGTQGDKKNKKLVYNVDLNVDPGNFCLKCLHFSSPKAGLGGENESFTQGKKTSFRIKVIPTETVKKGDQYALVVKISSQSHTEVIRTVLTATQDGKSPVETTEKENTSNAGTTRCVTDTTLLATPLGKHADIYPTQDTDASNDTTICSPDNTGTNSQTSDLNALTIMTLKDETRNGCMRNFVLITIRPSQKGMALSDFLVTASLSALGGTTMGSSNKKKNRFIYDKPLIACGVEELFLQNVGCLGANDTNFANGQAITFKIEVNPGTGINAGGEYTLTVTLSKKDSQHERKQSITLIAPLPSTGKVKK